MLPFPTLHQFLLACLQNAFASSLLAGGLDSHFTMHVFKKMCNGNTHHHFVTVLSGLHFSDYLVFLKGETSLFFPNHGGEAFRGMEQGGSEGMGNKVPGRN
jgi:hypothetical protein